VSLCEFIEGPRAATLARSNGSLGLYLFGFRGLNLLDILHGLEVRRGFCINTGVAEIRNAYCFSTVALGLLVGSLNGFKISNYVRI